MKRPKKCSAKNWKYVKWCEKLEVCDISQENWKYMIRVLRVPSETLGKHYFQQNPPKKSRCARFSYFYYQSRIIVIWGTIPGGNFGGGGTIPGGKFGGGVPSPAEILENKKL